ncbi:MAG: hypothetical protein ACKOWJ_02275 [Micrococcales bacterium]
MKKLVTLVVTALMATTAVIGGALPAQATPTAPGTFVDWNACVADSDQYCIDSTSIVLPNGAPSTLASQGLTFQAYFFNGDVNPTICINLLKAGDQALPIELLNASITFKLRTSTWQPGTAIHGLGRFVSYSTAKSGENYTVTATLKTIRYELNKDCGFETLNCSGAPDQVYPAFLQATVSPFDSKSTDATLTSSAGNLENDNWNSSNATLTFKALQPQTTPFTLETVLPAAQLAKSLGSTPAYVAANFKVSITAAGTVVGQGTLTNAGTALLMTASSPTGGILTVTLSPKKTLPAPVIKDIKVVTKTKQTIIVKASTAAKKIYFTCSSAKGATKAWTTSTFSSTPAMPKGAWMCSAQFVNGYRGPSSNPFSLYNNG